MNNQKYWENRSAWNMYHYMNEAEKTSDTIAEIYRKASRWLSMESEDVFERYMTKHRLSESEARRLLNMMQDKTSIRELLEKLQNNNNDTSKKELLAQLEAPAYQARLERFRQLQNQIDIVMKNVYDQEKDFSTQFYTDLGNEAYYRSIFEIQKRSELAFSFNHVSSRQIEKVLAMNWSGEHYSQRIWKNTQGLAQDLKEELLLNLITGRTERETAAIIANKFAQGASNARRLVRTESCFVSGELNAKAYEECGIEWYQFLATLDLRTSKICQSLDGKKFRVSERKNGKNYPPMHPWCRSTTISIVDESVIKELTRSAINPATGKRIKVPRTMNYQQWYEKYVRGKPEAELEEKKTRNRSSDRKQHENYKNVLGKNTPDKLDDFQEMKYTDSEKWNELKEAYKDVNWQRKALENHRSGEVHSVPYKADANSVFDKYEEGHLIQRRYYGRTGNPRLDIDMTNHGNSLKHSVVPHRHGWEELQDGAMKRSEVHDMPLKLGDKIANKDILKEGTKS